MWYMLLEPKLRVYSNLLPSHSASGFVNVRKGSASRWTVGSLVARVWEKFNEGRLRRQAIQEFANLDDRLLRDIGLDRDRIPETVDAMLRHQPIPVVRESRIGHESGRAGESFPARISKSLVKAWVRRRAINELARLDNSLLRDIGLDRDRIPEAVDAMLDRKAASQTGATVHYLYHKEEDEACNGYPTPAAA